MANSALQFNISGTLPNNICDGRLTLTSGTAVTTADVTGALNIYFTPYKGNRIALYDGSTWNVRTFSELTIALGTLSSGLPYDIFVYDSSGTVTVDTLVAWTNGTTRATALVLQDGVYVKSGATTRRYLGTFYTTATTTTEDSAARRLLWNAYNRIPRKLKAIDTTNSWTYTTATFRSSNASTTDGVGRVALVMGLSEDTVSVKATAVTGNSTSNVNCPPGIGIDSTSINSGDLHHGSGNTGVAFPNMVQYVSTLAVGYHFIQRLEYSTAAGTTTWYGDNGDPTITQSGLIGFTLA